MTKYKVVLDKLEQYAKHVVLVLSGVEGLEQYANVILDLDRESDPQSS